MIGGILAAICVGLLAMAGDGDAFSARSEGGAYIAIGAAIVGGLCLMLILIASAERAALGPLKLRKRAKSSRLHY